MKNNDRLSKHQELVDKHWKLIAKFRVILAAHEEFWKNRSELWEAGEEKEIEEVFTTYKRMVELLKETMDILLRSFRIEALTADSETPMEDLDEQLLLSVGQGANIKKFLGKYEGASELVVEVERAIEQVQKSLLAKAELKSEKEELETATKPVTNDAEPK